MTIGAEMAGHAQQLAKRLEHEARCIESIDYDIDDCIGPDGKHVAAHYRAAAVWIQALIDAGSK